MKHGLDKYALIFKALGDETRLKILLLLTGGKTCACKILEEFHFTQPTLSYHMKQLTDSGLVDADKKGKWVFYSLNRERVGAFREFITEINVIGDGQDCCNEEQ